LIVAQMTLGKNLTKPRIHTGTLWPRPLLACR
jgi:hypothetical protein